MYGKIMIKTKLEVLTGLHIGGSSTFAAIGAVSNPIIIDPTRNQPIVPGSSLKGKLRTLLARSITDSVKLNTHSQDDDKIKRLFGASGNPIVKARLQFSDSYVCNATDFKEIGMKEIKTENTINRKTGEAMPRQLERVVSGVQFEVRIVYDIDNKENLEEDMKNLAKAMKLLQMDYLGGHGTRGSGRVSFKEIETTVIEAPKYEKWKDILQDIKKAFKDVEAYELFSV